jgi:epoxyqueuosine reductase
MICHVSLELTIKERAIASGFDLVGIAPVAIYRDLEFARQWAERGCSGAMHYLSNPRRFDPRSVLPSVKSVICVGLIYDTSFPHSTAVLDGEVRSQESGVGRQRSDTAAPRAWISRYAWGRDYHGIMRGKLERLRAAIEELASGVETRVFVDTGPVVERAFARFSGIGWMGKNTCILNEQKGSWFFLGVILTNLALEPDLPAPDRCGSCTACLDACPTGALVEPYVMDASRCISYLTIELKGSIPPALRPGVGRNIFGCDICQDVCPWNRRSQESEVRSQEKSFEPMEVSLKPPEVSSWQSAVGSQQSAGADKCSTQNPKSQIQNPPDIRPPTPDTFSLFAPPLESLAPMTEEDFRQTFAHSPIKRTKYRGWLRNLSVAMGNSGDVRFVSRLEELSKHPDPIVREHADWGLDRLRGG